MADPTQLPRPLRAPARCRSRVASSCTRLVLQAMHSSPASQHNSSREVVITCRRWPVAGSMFCDSAVRVLLWKGASVAGPAIGVGREVFMASIVFFWPFAVIPRRSQFFGTRANAAISGANHG